MFREHWRIFVAIVFIGGVAALAVHLFLPDRATAYVVGGIAVATAWSFTEVLHSIDGMANQRLGIAGEQWTSDELRKLRKDGWRFVNHVMLERSDVDHAVLGPGGFFAMDSKYRTDWTVSRHNLGGLADAALWQARQLQSRLRLKTPIVKPVVVLWGPRVSTVFDGVFELNGATFCLGSELARYLRSLDTTIDEGTVERAFTSLDEYVTRRDVGETQEHGDPARTIAEHVEDIGIALVAASVAFLALTTITRVPPVGWWTVVLAAGFAALSLWLRRQRPASERTQRTTAAVLATSLGFGGIVLAVIVINLIWSG